MLLFFSLYALTGVLAGTLAGLLGVGGGLVIVPVLVHLFEVQRFPVDASIHLALGTSLASILFTSISSARAHHAQRAVDWGIVRGISLGIVLGTYGGGVLAARLPSSVLKGIFSLFLLLVAAQMLSGKKPRPSRGLPAPLGLNGVGLIIGAISSWVGIGGGSMSVPFMLWCNVPTRKAIGTSAALGFPIAGAGTVAYLVQGIGSATPVPYAVGYLHLPALAGISVCSMLMAPVGARLSSRLDPARVKRGFAWLLVVTGVKMAYGLIAQG